MVSNLKVIPRNEEGNAFFNYALLLVVLLHCAGNYDNYECIIYNLNIFINLNLNLCLKTQTRHLKMADVLQHEAQTFNIPH